MLIICLSGPSVNHSVGTHQISSGISHTPSPLSVKTKYTHLADSTKTLSNKKRKERTKGLDLTTKSLNIESTNSARRRVAKPPSSAKHMGFHGKRARQKKKEADESKTMPTFASPRSFAFYKVAIRG